MIKLTINPESNPKVLMFEESNITIGSSPAALNHLHLDEEGLQPHHIQIIGDETPAHIVNLNFDPFITVNGLPFGKKNLEVEDLIKIGNCTIRIDELNPEASTIDNSATTPAFDTDEIPADCKVEAVVEKENPLVQILKTVIQSKKFYVGVASFLVFLSIFAGITYRWIAARSIQDQAIAAEGVSDIAMALVYARVHHIKPQKQSWIDPEFLTSNLSAILSAEYATFANIDKQGQFQNCPYLLRVYTSSDLSQFIVIAQPSAGWLSWFMSPDAIVIGSQSMELRAISDLKTLNRLVVNSAILDSNSSSDAFQFIQQGELVTLETLGKKKGFATPKTLALLRPGAENRIYNAPRYFHFGESILKQALNLLHNNGNAQELTRLQQQVDGLKLFADLVLYNTLGLERAIEGQRALTSLMAPRLPFLFAYLSIDSDGKILNSQLLIESNDETIAQADRKEKELSENHKASHPIYLELSILSKERNEVLKIIGSSIQELLDKNNRQVLNDFDEQLTFLVSKYQRVNNVFRDRIANRIIELHLEYTDLPSTEFQELLIKVGLLDLANDSLKIDKELKLYQNVESNILEAIFKNIENSNSLKDLYNNVEELSSLLEITQDAQLAVYQDKLKKTTKQKLNQFLAANVTLDFDEALLTKIFSLAFIQNKEEVAHFLNQFSAKINNSNKDNNSNSSS